MKKLMQRDQYRLPAAKGNQKQQHRMGLPRAPRP
jgi:hypothetical protein